MKYKNPNILFVCYGNTCRSPMAEGLAKKMLKDEAIVESAGINPVFDSASDDAIKVLKEHYDVDISSHRPRHINEVRTDEFDYVIVLDHLVYKALEKYYKMTTQKMILWVTADPFSQGTRAHRKCAEKLNRRIEQFVEEHF